MPYAVDVFRGALSAARSPLASYKPAVSNVLFCFQGDPSDNKPEKRHICRTRRYSKTHGENSDDFLMTMISDPFNPRPSSAEKNTRKVICYEHKRIGSIMDEILPQLLHHSGEGKSLARLASTVAR